MIVWYGNTDIIEDIEEECDQIVINETEIEDEANETNVGEVPNRQHEIVFARTNSLGESWTKTKSF